MPPALGSYAQLRNTINQSLKDYVTKDGERRRWLIVNPINERPYKSLNKPYQTAFGTKELIQENNGNNITANVLRHSYITWQTLEKKLTDPELKNLAMLQLHSTQTQQEAYLQMLDKFVPPEFS